MIAPPPMQHYRCVHCRDIVGKASHIRIQEKTPDNPGSFWELCDTCTIEWDERSKIIDDYTSNTEGWLRTDLIQSEEWRVALPHECQQCTEHAIDFPPTSGCMTCAYAGWIPPPCATHFGTLKGLGAKWTPSVFPSLTDYNECTKYPRGGWWPHHESGSEVPIHMTELKEWRPELRERMPNMWYDEPQKDYFRI